MTCKYIKEKKFKFYHLAQPSHLNFEPAFSILHVFTERVHTTISLADKKFPRLMIIGACLLRQSVNLSRVDRDLIKRDLVRHYFELLYTPDGSK